MIKAVKVLNLFSTLLFITILLLIYAYLPISVDLNIKGLHDIHKQQFFYYAVASFVVINILLRVVFTHGLKSSSENIFAWMTLLIFILNLYLTFIVGFVGVWNNSTHIDPSNYSYLNFLGSVFLVIWIGGLVFLVIKNIDN